MKLFCMLVASIVVASFSAVSLSHAAGESPVAPANAFPPSADPLDIPVSLQAQIDAARAACHCFTSVTPLEVVPPGTPDEVFRSIDVLFAAVGQDIQLPWVAAGEINRGALANLLGRQAGLITQLSAFADPSSTGFRLGAYKWSHPTQPDFCSSETLYLMYVPSTGVLFVFRFDSSSEC
jgi:hypothetical protein